jgi:16S rRNA (cytosine1402-N4)-methyltransferase
LRIEVNRELDTLPVALDACLDLLRPEGRLCVISYHSLEDRIVKRFIARELKGCICPPDLPVCACGREPEAELITRRAVRPSEGEVAHNPRAGSGRLRAALKLASAGGEGSAGRAPKIGSEGR